MNTARVREAAASDLPAIGALLGKLAEVARGTTPPGEPELQRLFGSMQASPGVYHNLVAHEQGRVVGFLSLVCYKTLLHPGGTALINELVVEAACRGRGIGRLLVEEAVRRARAAGMDEIEVGTQTDNRAAIGFYQACGFDRRYVLLGREFETALKGPAFGRGRRRS